MTQKEWQYRIEPYRRIPGENAMTRVPDDQAEMWFGFRDKGDDHRCFGVFPSRADAEKMMAILKGPQPEKTSEFDRMLMEAKRNDRGREEQEQGKDRDRGRE